MACAQLVKSYRQLLLADQPQAVAVVRWRWRRQQRSSPQTPVAGFLYAGILNAPCVEVLVQSMFLAFELLILVIAALLSRRHFSAVDPEVWSGHSFAPHFGVLLFH